MSWSTSIRCPNCTGLLDVLFYSVSCEHCDNPPKGTFFLGFVNLYARDFYSAKHPIYPNVDTARASYDNRHGPVVQKMVLSPCKIYWAAARISSFLYMIYPNHKYQFSGPEDTAFIVSEALRVKQSGGFEADAHWVII